LSDMRLYATHYIPRRQNIHSGAKTLSPLFSNSRQHIATQNAMRANDYCRVRRHKMARVVTPSSLATTATLPLLRTQLFSLAFSARHLSGRTRTYIMAGRAKPRLSGIPRAAVHLFSSRAASTFSPQQAWLLTMVADERGAVARRSGDSRTT